MDPGFRRDDEGIVDPDFFTRSKAGIQGHSRRSLLLLDSRFRGNDEPHFWSYSEKCLRTDLAIFWGSLRNLVHGEFLGDAAQSAALRHRTESAHREQTRSLRMFYDR